MIAGNRNLYMSAFTGSNNGLRHTIVGRKFSGLIAFLCAGIRAAKAKQFTAFDGNTQCFIGVCLSFYVFA